MQLSNMPDLKVIAWTQLEAPVDLVSKNNVDMHVTHIKEAVPLGIATAAALVSDFVLLAQTSLTLIKSDQARQPDVDAREALNLIHLGHLKSDAEQILKNSTVLPESDKGSLSVYANGEHIDLTAGAMEMKLVMLSVELSEIIDKLLRGRLQSQKDRNVQIEELNDLIDELRKLEKSSESFTAEDLEKPYKSLPSNSPIRLRGIERMQKAMEKEKMVVTAAAEKRYQTVLTWSRDFTGFNADYIQAQNSGYNNSMTVSPEGTFLFWNNKKHAYRGINPPHSFFKGNWGRDELKAAYAWKKEQLDESDRKFNIYAVPANGKVSLNDMLLGYGIYKEGEKLPATKEELEAAREKISSMVNSINSTQTLKMLDINKFTNGRNEAYDLAVKVNNSKSDSLNALIRMIGER